MNILTFSLSKSEHILQLLQKASQSNMRWIVLSIIACIIIIWIFCKSLNIEDKIKHNKIRKVVSSVVFTFVVMLIMFAIISGVILNVNTLWMTDTEARYIEYNCAKVPEYKHLRKEPYVKRLFRESEKNALMKSPRFNYKYCHKMPHQVTKVSWWQYL